ncbi:MAG: sigma-70 family RNA polymerase sigma factor [Clostridia bacterium]|nr:sigma-70 family RNA polymerase sigma factor [Clostridia bacterium]
MDTVKGPDSKEKRIEHMVTLYQLPLLRLCIMYLHDEDQAKDAVQETFIKAYRNLDSFRDDSSEKTWLIRIAVNTCKNICRSGWFRHIDRSVTPDMLVSRSAPEDRADNDLTEEIMDLPVKLREVALLCWLQGMTCEEAAKVLSISRQAVGSRLNRARKKLRFALEGSDDHDHE